MFSVTPDCLPKSTEQWPLH